MRPVEVLATGPVFEVAYELDGREVVRLSGSRLWKQEVDFGAEYVPHELVARAYDRAGKEIASVRQWINLPRPPAEVEILIERDKSGKAIGCRLAWASRMGPRPKSLALTFDGQPLSVDASGRAVLPAHDASLPHVLSAEVEFPGNLRSHADSVLGGGSTGEAGSDLTAIPVLGTSSRPPTVESLQSRFQANGKTLRVTAVEHEPVLVLLVRDPAENKEALRHFGQYDHRLGMMESRLEIDDRLQLVWPLATEVPDQNASNVIFDASNVIQGNGTNFLQALLARPRKAAKGSDRRFADAVAVAGVSAAASGSRRAIVLVLGENDWDHSSRDAASIRRYLERINVPLYVWSLAVENPPGVAPAAQWGEFDDVSTVVKLGRAANRVLEDLRRQSIVWVEGRLLPQDITLTQTGDGLSIAR